MVKSKSQFTMKQPELGKKISEWRKAKGMTQEELVEKCNLNVRTIQRIEAGEVMPRSYTIKALMEALEIRESIQEEQTSLMERTPNFLYAALAGGIIYFFASIFEIGLEGEYVSGNYSIKMLGYLFAKSLSVLGYVLFGLGWIILTKKYLNQFLKISWWIIISATIIWFLVDLAAITISEFEMGDYYLVKVSSFGFFYVLLGMGFISYKKQFSMMGMVIGVLTLVSGVLIFSGVGAFLGLIPLTLAELGQIGLMIYLIQQYGRRNSPILQPEF